MMRVPSAIRREEPHNSRQAGGTIDAVDHAGRGLRLFFVLERLPGTRARTADGADLRLPFFGRSRRARAADGAGLRGTPMHLVWGDPSGPAPRMALAAAGPPLPPP